MLTDERMETYLKSLDMGNTDFLVKLEEEAIADLVPIIRPSMQRLIKVLLKMNKPSEILEVGTAVGFSAILMAEYGGSDCRITTIEKYEKRIPIAKENFVKAGKEEQITLIEGDAAKVLTDLRSSNMKYDFIFMDAAKGQYINFYENVIALLNSGGVLLTDNVLQEGNIIESRFAVTRRDRTIHSRMRDYLYTITHDLRLTTSILPIGDGVAISVKEM